MLGLVKRAPLRMMKTLKLFRMNLLMGLAMALAPAGIHFCQVRRALVSQLLRICVGPRLGYQALEKI
jgi:hypothetical protein